MASLKEIMNIDEDSFDSEPLKKGKESVPRSSRASDSIPTTSNHVSPTDPSFVPSSGRALTQSPSTHTSQSLATAAASPSPSASNPDSRRRSTTSSDSMDPLYYGQGHGYAIPGGIMTSAGGSRSYPSAAPPPNEAPIKLTPITGRVSRAKKGVPVHICQACNKTFTRAEHLRRHQLSHQPADLHCAVPGCDKSFHRRDLLERHQLRHEQEARVQPSAGGHSAAGGSGSSYMDPSLGPGFPGPPQSLGGQLHGQGLHYGVPGQDQMTGWPPMGDGQGYSGGDMPPSQGDVPGGYRMDTYGAASAGLGGAYMPATSNGHWQDSSAGSASTSTSNASGFSNDNFGLAQRDIPSPMLDTSPSFYTYTTSPQQAGSSAIYDSTLGLPLAGYGEDGLPSPNLLSTTVRSLTPPPAVAQSSETLVTLPAAAPSERIAATAGQQPSHTRQPEDLLGLMASNASAQPSLCSEARSAVPIYLDVYWQKVAPQYPIIHRPTVEDAGAMSAEQRDMLQCSMAAVATQFLEGKNHRVHGNNLHAYAWASSKMFTAASEWSLPVMQTVLLCEYYARFRGRKKESHRPSSRFAQLYQMVINTQNTFSCVSEHNDMAASWRRWVDAESRRRLLSACFLLDVHSMIYYEQPPIVISNLDYSSPSTLPVPLLTTTVKLWGAGDATAWAAQAALAEPIETIQSIMARNPTAAQTAAAPPFDAAIMLAGYALTLEKRKSLTKPEPQTSQSPSVQRLASVFPSSCIADSYLALHYTPLHVLLSVSGESWVFNKKVARSSMFSEHRTYLGAWAKSSNALMAVSFAARALRSFLNLNSSSLLDACSFIDHIRGGSWNDISDYWGVYVCTLIIWAFGNYQDGTGKGDATRRTGLQWIAEASAMEARDISGWKDRGNTLAVVCLVRDVLARDCTGGRSILFADSVSVLRKLAGRDDWEWPS